MSSSSSLDDAEDAFGDESLVNELIELVELVDELLVLNDDNVLADDNDDAVE